MKKKIYRLAEESDIGKKALFTNYIRDIEDSIFYINKFKGFSTDQYFPFAVADTMSGHFSDVYKYAYVEVTLADFSDDEIINYLENKYEGLKKLFVNTRAELLKDREVTKNIALKNLDRGREKIYFTKEDILNSYNSGYAAAKKEFEPKWISVDEKLPGKEGKYLCIRQYVFNGEMIHCVVDFYKKKWLGDLTITHWMPLPAPPEQDKTSSLDMAEPGEDKTVHVIRKEDKVIYREEKKFCKHCDKEYVVKDSNATSGALWWRSKNYE